MPMLSIVLRIEKRRGHRLHVGGFSISAYQIAATLRRASRDGRTSSAVRSKLILHRHEVGGIQMIIENWQMDSSPMIPRALDDSLRSLRTKLIATPATLVQITPMLPLL